MSRFSPNPRDSPLHLWQHGALKNSYTLLLFGVFALCILAVLLTGADAYKRLSGRDQVSYDERTAGQYLTTRVRQADRLGGVEVASFQGVDTLILTEEIEGEAYETRVYCYDGYLREMFCVKGAALPPTFGEQILPMEDLELDFDGKTITATLSMTDGSQEHMTLHLRSEGGAEE